ncbi:MAG TPA: tetratricopeptide repeat protein [Chthoniobacterales bacterium]|nr:tetratricopeptide repeat protein [Chthoniobacterales bacterium]
MRTPRGVTGAVVLLTLSLAPPGFSSNFVRSRVGQTSSSRAKQQTGAISQDDSFSPTAPKDLVLRAEGEHKAEALAHFVAGSAFEENGEIDKALDAYRQVLNVDPGQCELASHVAELLSRQSDFPQAIDVLKDAIAVNPNKPEPYLQLAFIYAKYLKRPDQAIDYVNRAITIDPHDIRAYQRLFELLTAAGDDKKALLALERAAKVQSDNASFWARLGKLYAAAIFKPGHNPTRTEMTRANELFKKAAEYGKDDAAVLKDVAEFYASSQQLQQAIPIYLRVLELQPDDLNAREKLATSFVLTNQHAKAVEILEQLIKEHPENDELYDLLAQILDDDARSLDRANRKEEARMQYEKAAANYEQSLLIAPTHPNTYLRLSELLLGPCKDAERAVKLLNEARRRFPSVPELIYYLALAQREAKQPQDAVATFEEARRQAELEDSEMVNARFYFNYGATAEQAGLYDKAADLFRQSIAMDPANAADACNYLGYMWVQQNTHLDEAEAMIKRALQSEPDNGAYLDSLGWLEFRQGKFEQALSDLLRATKSMTRDDPVVFEHIGDTYLQLKRMPQALEAWQKALALDPGNKTLAEKIESAKTMMSKSEPRNSGA